MPQLAPISLLLMFFLFLISFLLMMIYTFFNFSFTLPKSKIFSSKSINWKW